MHDSLIFSISSFLISVIGIFMGMFARKKISKDLLTDEAKGSINLAIALVAMLTALTLGSTISTSKMAFDATENSIKKMSVEILALDGALLRYGKDADEVRAELRGRLKNFLQSNEVTVGSNPKFLLPHFLSLDDLLSKISVPDIKNMHQQNEYSRVKAIADDLLKSRWLSVNNIGASVHFLFLLVLQLWIFVIFFTYSLTAQNNMLVVATFVLCAFSVSAAMFLLVELDEAFDGFIMVSYEPLHFAYQMLSP